MGVYRCDRCGKQYIDIELYEGIFFISSNRYFDLCKDCAESLIKFLKPEDINSNKICKEDEENDG